MSRTFAGRLTDVVCRFLMVDVVVNNVMSLDTDLSDLSTYMFKDKVGSFPLRYVRLF